MYKIVVRWYDGQNVQQYEYDDIDEANEKYNTLINYHSTIKRASIEIVTTTTLKSFARS